MKRVALRRSVALRAGPRRDPVTAQVHAEVIERDLRKSREVCVAPHLDALAGMCRDRWGTPVLPYAREALTLDHVRPEPAMGRRGPSESRWLASICFGHHLGGWATSHRPELRRYLEEYGR